MARNLHRGLIIPCDGAAKDVKRRVAEALRTQARLPALCAHLWGYAT
jgi:hypothetical protein